MNKLILRRRIYEGRLWLLLAKTEFSRRWFFTCLKSVLHGKMIVATAKAKAEGTLVQDG
jgi:hypothetical protein